MKAKGIIFLIIILCISSVYSQSKTSLIMTRCSKNDKELLSSPSQMNLSNLQNNFNDNQDTMIFVHGFKTSFSDATKNYQASINHLQPALGNLNYVGFHWPGNFLIDFGAAIKNANKSGAYLIYLLQKIQTWYGNSNCKIHIISHSLGARVTLQALKCKRSSLY